jgi:C4-dicarboxylate transporter DctQ subunit
MNGLRRLSAIAAKIEDFAACVFGATALGLATLSALGRYLMPGIAPPWAGEATTYLIVWGVFVAAGSLVARNGHVRSDMLVVRLSRRGQLACEVATCLIAIACMAVFVAGGIEIVRDGLAWDERSPSELRFPLWLYYLAMPVGSALMLAYYAARLARCFVDPALEVIEPTNPGSEA